MIHVFCHFWVTIVWPFGNICDEICCKTKMFAKKLRQNATISIQDFVPKITTMAAELCTVEKNGRSSFITRVNESIKILQQL